MNCLFIRVKDLLANIRITCYEYGLRAKQVNGPIVNISIARCAVCNF